VFIKSDDRKKTWKEHFEVLLNNTSDDIDDDCVINPLFPINNNIPSGNFSMEEVKKGLNR